MRTVINQSNSKSVYKHIKILNNIKYIYFNTQLMGWRGARNEERTQKEHKSGI